MSYLKGVALELRKITWIPKLDLCKWLFTVVLVVVLLTTYIYAVDSVFARLYSLVINLF